MWCKGHARDQPSTMMPFDVEVIAGGSAAVEANVACNINRVVPQRAVRKTIVCVCLRVSAAVVQVCGVPYEPLLQVLVGHTRHSIELKYLLNMTKVQFINIKSCVEGGVF